MASLRWVEDQQIALRFLEGEVRVLELSLAGAHWETFFSALSSMLRTHGDSEKTTELRLELPQGWRLFFKQGAESETRFLVARPSTEEWVGTLSFSRQAGDSWLQFEASLEATVAPPFLEVLFGEWIRAQAGAAGRIWRMSNFDLKIRRLPG